MNSARALLFLTLFAGLSSAQDPAGIPIDDQLTIRKCGGCHQRDAKGMMKRISYMRTSPEIWEQAIKRMIRLNGLTVTPAEVRDILRYLSANNGLAPEEMKPGFWEVEHRTNGYQDDYTPSPVLQKTCNSCHNIGRVLAQRRTRDDYEKLVSMHVGLFPGSASTFRPPKSKGLSDVNAPARPSITPSAGIAMEYPRASAAAAADAKYPVDLALDYLAKNQPLITPEWTSWRAAMRPAKLTGTWRLHGYQPGLGKIFGTVAIAPGAGDDQFVTTVQFTYVNTGATVKTTGKGIMYTGYNWRGRTGASTEPPITATATPTAWREALMLTRDGNKMDGRWYWSGFGELGIDVHLTRQGSEPLVIGTDVSALRLSSTAQTVKIIGANFPAAIQPADIDFGRGVTVSEVTAVTPTVLTVEVSVAANVPVGLRDIVIGRSTATEAISVYDKIAYIEVAPEVSVSRLGGLKYPKEYAQFEAIAWAAGPDGKPQTDDDVYVGAVPARWTMEEFTATPNDDDTKFVGTLNDGGFFTPNAEGINPQRKIQTNNHANNNYGDVWIVADYKAPDGREFKSKAYLVVTVPNYTLYDQPEVVQ